MNHLTQEDLILLYYNEPGLGAEAREHAAECAVCRAEMAALAQTMNLCNEWNVPEPAADFERSVWAQLVPGLTSEARPRMLWRQPVWRWLAAGAAAAVLFLAAFLAGRVSRHESPSITAGLSDRARQRILVISLADHLDRAGNLLTEISNVSDTDAGGGELVLERSRAQDLVDEGRLLRQMLSGRGETATLAVFDEVERFMVEVANEPDTVTAADVRELRDRLASQSLLFKVRIVGSNLRSEGQRS